MKLSTTVLGETVTKQLRAKETQAVLTIGKDTFTRADLSKVACWNFAAAANLSAILNRELDVKDTRDVYERIPWTALALPRLGSISLAVLGAAFEAKKLGGESPLQAWVEKHRESDADPMGTFTSMKHREAKERSEEEKVKTQRKEARRGKAHAIRVERFTVRQQKAKVTA